MSRLRRWVSLGIGVALLAAAGCGRDQALDRIGKALAQCEDRSPCAKAIAELRSLDRDRRDSADGVEVRLKALHRSIAALAAFPDPDRTFLEEAGLEPERATAFLDEEARALEALGSRAAGVEDARTVLATMRQPSCERLQGLETVESRGGRFADLALLERLSVVAQIVASVDPYRVQSNAAAAQMLLGCRLPQDAEDAEVLVAARVLLDGMLDRCPRAPAPRRR